MRLDVEGRPEKQTVPNSKVILNSVGVKGEFSIRCGKKCDKSCDT